MDDTAPTANNARKTGRQNTKLARSRGAGQAREGAPRGGEEAGLAAWRPAAVQQRLNRLWRVSIFILFLVLLATIVHIIQFFIPSGLTNQLYANIVQGNRASVRQAPESKWTDLRTFASTPGRFQMRGCADNRRTAPFIIRPFVESNPEQRLSQKGVLTDNEGAVYAADIPRKLPNLLRRLNTADLRSHLLTCPITGGRGFVKQKDEQGKEAVYAVSAMHQLRCLVR